MKNKVLIIGGTDVDFMPYISLYNNKSLYNNASVELCYWQRRDGDSNHNDLIFNKIHVFKCRMNDQIPLISKIYSIYKFRHYLLKLIKKNKYTHLIILHSINAFIITDYLLLNSVSFVIDFRDLTYERNFFFRNIMQKLMNRSKFVVFSSYGFSSIYNLKVSFGYVHNLDKNTLNKDIKYLSNSDKIQLSFWGFVRDKNLYKLLIKNISKNKKIIFHLYGKEDTVWFSLKKLVEEENISNVKLYGRYNNVEKLGFLKKTNIVCNLYSKNFNSDRALGNKFYDSILYGKIQLVNKKSLMGEICEKHNLGITIDLPNIDLKSILSQFNRFDMVKFQSERLKLINIFMKENLHTLKSISNVLK